MALPRFQLQSLLLLSLITQIQQSSPLNTIVGPITHRRYDQTDILMEEEDRRDIMRDIKTVFAPEYRIYPNDSSLNSDKRKRESRELHGVVESGDLDLNDERLHRRVENISLELVTSSPRPRTTVVPVTTTGREDMNVNMFWDNSLSTEEIRRLQSQLMRKYMHRSVDPCNDFYEYACGNWKKYHTMPPDRSTYDTFELIREKLDRALKDLIEDTELPKGRPKGALFLRKSLLDEDFVPRDEIGATAKAKIFYMSCMNEKLIAKRSDLPLRNILDQLGGWPILGNGWNETDYDVVRVLAKLRILNNDILIAQWVGPDMKNSNEYIIHIDQTSLGLPSREYYLKDSNMKYLRAYKVFILTVAQNMGVESVKAEREVEEIVQFETEIAEIMASNEERRNISEMYLRTDIASLELYFPQFDWKVYFETVLGTKINLSIPVACYCSKFLHELFYLLSNTPAKTIQNYLIWRFVRHRTNNLDQKFMEARQRFYHVLFGREKQPPRWQFCVAQVNSNMGMALGSLFVRKYFDKSSKIDTIEMTKRMEEAFKITLLENTWLDNSTKEYARMKLDYMDLKIGFPDIILNMTELSSRYKDVELLPDYFLENVMTILRHISRAERNKLGTMVNRTLWSTPPAVVNAYYSRNKNQIMFPAGMLQPPFYNRHFPKALNYGGIGVVIGHEITHGFDDKGRLFDHEGNLHLWWRESSIEKFYEKSQCMINQYDQYVLPEIKISLDGYATQGENIADNGGLKQAYKAYRAWLKENPRADETLPGLNMSNYQLFFLNFAQVWCGQQRIEAAKSRMKISVHSPGIFRVIGALSNSVEFAQAFNCPKNSPMNPEEKCIIW